MFEKVRELKNRYTSTDVDAEKEIINAQLKALQDSDPDAYAEAMLECIRESNQKARKLLVREQIESVLPAISISYISKEYFHKSKEWFYQRLNGNIVNGKPAAFTEEEIKTLNLAFKDLGKKISSFSVRP